MNDVIQRGVAWMPPFTPPTAESMGAEGVNLQTAMATLVWLAERGAKSEAHGYPDCLIVHPQSQVWCGQGLQPGTRFAPTGS